MRSGPIRSSQKSGAGAFLWHLRGQGSEEEALGLGPEGGGEAGEGAGLGGSQVATETTEQGEIGKVKEGIYLWATRMRIGTP